MPPKKEYTEKVLDSQEPLKEKTAFEKKAEEINTAREKKKGGRGRPKGAKNKKTFKPTNEANPIISNALKGLFGILASRANDKRLELTKEEADNLALPYTQLCDYYLPDMTPISFVWINAVFTTVTIVKTKFSYLPKTEKPKKPKEVKTTLPNVPQGMPRGG